MQWRGPAVLAALLAIGAGSGYAASGSTADAIIGVGVPAPVPARPELPVDAPTPFTTDPDDPPLVPGVALTETTRGTGKFQIVFPAPTGWSTNTNASNEWKWKQPGTSNNTYVMRIEQVTSQDITIEDAIDIQIDRLRNEQDDVAIVERGGDRLEYTYRSDEGNARHSFMRWLDLDASGQADVEIVVHGREVDLPGTRDLIQRVSDGMRGASA